MPTMSVTYEILKPYTYNRGGYEDQDYETVDEFDYDIEYGIKDIVDYLKSKDYKGWSAEKKEGYIAGVESVYYYFTDEIIEVLEEDECFIDFLKSRHESKAMKDYYESIRD